jgi:trans-aconitate 2-methyltransferase
LPSFKRGWPLEALRLLKLNGTERVLDIGCGNGKVTAQIASRIPEGTVVGIDPSSEMIAFASSQFPFAMHANLQFEVGDARSLRFRDESTSWFHSTLFTGFLTRTRHCVQFAWR